MVRLSILGHYNYSFQGVLTVAEQNADLSEKCNSAWRLMAWSAVRDGCSVRPNIVQSRVTSISIDQMKIYGTALDRFTRSMYDLLNQLMFSCKMVLVICSNPTVKWNQIVFQEHKQRNKDDRIYNILLHVWNWSFIDWFILPLPRSRKNNRHLKTLTRELNQSWCIGTVICKISSFWMRIYSHRNKPVPRRHQNHWFQSHICSPGTDMSNSCTFLSTFIQL